MPLKINNLSWQTSDPKTPEEYLCQKNRSTAADLCISNQTAGGGEEGGGRKPEGGQGGRQGEPRYRKQTNKQTNKQINKHEKLPEKSPKHESR